MVVAVRLVTWNCCMAAHTKLEELLALRPDIAVLPECAAPEVAAAKSVYASSSSHTWVGDYPQKGLAVLAFGQYVLEPAAVPDLIKGRFALPVHVRGPVSFNLLAVWTQNAGRVPRYVRSADDALTDHDAFLRSGPVIVAGDFNSNVLWDRERKDRLGHDRLVQRLHDLGLESAYHGHFNEQQGAESRPTYFQNRNLKRPYHLDYVFMPKEWTARCHVEVGDAASWLKHSDHMPMVVTKSAADELGG